MVSVGRVVAVGERGTKRGGGRKAREEAEVRIEYGEECARVCVSEREDVCCASVRARVIVLGGKQAMWRGTRKRATERVRRQW
jgi:hypothetical protein